MPEVAKCNEGCIQCECAFQLTHEGGEHGGVIPRTNVFELSLARGLFNGVMPRHYPVESIKMGRDGVKKAACH